MLKQVTIECDVPDGYEAVAYRFPKKGELYVDNGSNIERATVDYSLCMCLIVRPIPPALVPLGPEDVVPGKTLIRRNDWPKSSDTLVIGRSVRSVDCVGSYCSPAKASVGPVQYADLQRDWSYSNDHGKTWQPCSKPA